MTRTLGRAFKAEGFDAAGDNVAGALGFLDLAADEEVGLLGDHEAVALEEAGPEDAVSVASINPCSSAHGRRVDEGQHAVYPYLPCKSALQRP